MMHKVELFSPEISGQTAKFSWRVEPETALYHHTSFQLLFPDSVDLMKVPRRLWWDVLLICLHQHWPLLRPCSIHLPLKLSQAEKTFWLRLLENAIDTLESLRSEALPRRPIGIDIVDGDLEIPHSAIHGSGYGAAFSSGKDSLLQAALLFELTERPLLVTTTSPLPPRSDHEAVRRRVVFKAMKERRDPVFVEVISDFRTSCDNAFAAVNGYPIAISELTDTFLYMVSLLVAGAALGRTRLFLASEAEVQENAEVNGTIIQHPHFMYSAATQRSFSSYLAPYGIRFGSLITPLYSMQVQQLLWARYPDLSDLQYSCWRVGPDQDTCSACEQCMRIAFTALAAGHDPERMGIDLARLMLYSPEWTPVSDPSHKTIPQAVTGARLRSHVVGAIKQTNVLRFGGVLWRANRRSFLSSETLRMLLAYQRLRKRVSKLPHPARVGVRESFLKWLDPDLRERLIDIYTKQFSVESSDQHADVFNRSRLLTERVINVLDNEGGRSNP